MKKLILLIVISFTFSGISLAQSVINVKQSNAINILVDKHIKQNKKQEGVPGYRLQIFYATGSKARSKANNVRSRFMSRFPGVKSYLTYTSPNYKVRVGNFRTKADAKFFLEQIKGDYPNAFIIKDDIDFPSF